LGKTISGFFPQPYVLWAESSPRRMEVPDAIPKTGKTPLFMGAIGFTDYNWGESEVGIVDNELADCIDKEKQCQTP